MKRAALFSLLACLVSSSALAQATFNRFDCTHLGNSSECTASDGTKITCHGNNLGCEVTHPNGFVSSGPGPVAILIGSLIAMHRRHVTKKAMHEESAVVAMTVDYVMMLSDSTVLIERLLPYVPANQRNSYKEVEAFLGRTASQFSVAVSAFAKSYSGASAARFRANAKALRKLHDMGLVPVCGMRRGDMLLTNKLDTVRAHAPLDLLKALDAVESDEGLLAAECSSKRAIKLLKKQAEKVKAQAYDAPSHR